MKDDISYYVSKDLAVSGFVLGNDTCEVQRVGKKLSDFLGATVDAIE